MELKGRSVLVTGGSGALGSVVSRRFLSEGASVSISFLHEKEITASVTKDVHAIQADVTMESDVQRLFEQVIQRQGHLDIVVNTVGGFLPRKALTEVSVAEWDLMFNINLKSSFLCTREALRRMKGSSYGRVVNISAMVGLKPSAARAPYAISKAGVSMLTEIAAEEVKGSGITVNAIAPSIIATEANKRSMSEEDFSKWVTPEQITDTICFLCSQSAVVITGTTLRAFGGV